MVLILTCYENEMHCILKPGLFDEQTQKYGLLVLILELKSTVISCSPKLSHFHRNEEQDPRLQGRAPGFRRGGVTG